MILKVQSRIGRAIIQVAKQVLTPDKRVKARPGNLFFSKSPQFIEDDLMTRDIAHNSQVDLTFPNTEARREG